MAATEAEVENMGLLGIFVTTIVIIIISPFFVAQRRKFGEGRKRENEGDDGEDEDAVETKRKKKPQTISPVFTASIPCIYSI